MSALPYMPLYVADYLADTAHLTALENGAYLMLIMNYWQRGKSLPGGGDQLARIARVTREEWAQIGGALEEFFDVVDGQWVHNRIETELAKVHEKSIKASNAGKASAQRKSNARPSDVQQVFNERSTPVEQMFNHTDTDKETESKKESAKALLSMDLGIAYADFVELAKDLNLATPQALTPERSKHLTNRLSDCGGLDGWRLAMGKIRGSPFLNGSKTDFKASFDFVLQKSSFRKIMEGNYDAPVNGSKSHKPTIIERFRAGIERSGHDDSADGSGRHPLD